jgi:hypothetical protein
MSFICLYIYIPPLFLKFIGKPIIDMKIEDSPINTVPFPAITICTGVFAKDNIVNHFKNPDEHDEVKKLIFAASFQACDHSYIQNFPDCCGNKTDENIVDYLDQSSLSVEEVFAVCSIDKFDTNCSYVVDKILTDRGFCYRINAQGYHAIFNPGVLSDDFDNYKLTGKDLWEVRFDFEKERF